MHKERLIEKCHNFLPQAHGDTIFQFKYQNSFNIHEELICMMGGKRLHCQHTVKPDICTVDDGLG